MSIFAGIGIGCGDHNLGIECLPGRHTFHGNWCAQGFLFQRPRLVKRSRLSAAIAIVDTVTISPRAPWSASALKTGRQRATYTRVWLFAVVGTAPLADTVGDGRWTQQSPPALAAENLVCGCRVPERTDQQKATGDYDRQNFGGHDFSLDCNVGGGQRVSAGVVSEKWS